MVAPTAPTDPTFQSMLSSSGFGKQTADLLQYLGTDSGWTTAGFVASAGWGTLDCICRTIGPVCWLGLKATRTGANITSTAGNIVDTDLLTVPSGFRPAVAGGVWSQSVNFAFRATASSGMAAIASGGLVILATADGAINTNDNVFAWTSYPVD